MSWTALTEGVITFASEVNGNFQHVGLEALLPLGNSATMAATSGVYDIGSSSYRWRGVYLNNLYATGQTISLSGGSLRIDGTLTVDTLVLSATALHVGNMYWASAGSTSAYTLSTGTSKFMKLLTSSKFGGGIATLTVAHGISSGRSRIIAVWGASDLYDSGVFTLSYHGDQINDSATNYYKRFSSFTWDDTNVYADYFGVDEAWTSTAYIVVEYTE